MPGNSIDQLDASSLIFSGASNTTKALKSVWTFAMNKACQFCPPYHHQPWVPACVVPLTD